MEYCEKKTLRDLIQQGFFRDSEKQWGIFRQIVEGLSDIHKRNIIHRDLKPDNIFIDKDNNPKIGDFGLAKSGHFSLTGKPGQDSESSDLTKDVGTKLYTAPEISSSAAGSYDIKVDMYSLGIIFFEMCYHFDTLMERITVVTDLRDHCRLPNIFNSSERQSQRSIIESLITHEPDERPSCLELLQSGKLPFDDPVKSEQDVLRVLSDPTSPAYRKMMQSIFSALLPMGDVDIKASAWDHHAGSFFAKDQDTALLKSLVREKLCQIFRRHGAVEEGRPAIFPVSTVYNTINRIHLVTISGTVVQLPYDLTLPNARELARTLPPADRTYTFGAVFRDDHPNAAPKSIVEANFDIVSHNTEDLLLKEAEVLEVIDEIVAAMPSLSVPHMALHLNHWDLLEMILEFCRIDPSVRPAVKDVLSQLNIQNQTWSKLSRELRAPPIGLSPTVLDHLAKFDFRDTPDEALGRVRSLFAKTDYASRMKPIAAHIQEVVSNAKIRGVRTKMFVCPLGCAKDKFYQSGIMFQCVLNAKGRDVLAAGGRYDQLIAQNKPIGRKEFTGCHAVGMSLAFDRLVHSIAQLQKKTHKQSATRKKNIKSLVNDVEKWALPRCDVLVAALDSRSLRLAGQRVVSHLCRSELHAELAGVATSLDDVLARCANDKHGWVVLVKSDAGQDVSEIRVHDRHTMQDIDISLDNLVPHLQTEIQSRDRRMGYGESRGQSRVPANSADQDTGADATAKRADVQVLLAQHKSKKSNRGSVVEATQARVQDLMATHGAPRTVAVEASDAALEALRGARFGDADAWRRAAQAAPAAERDYLQQIRKVLGKFKDDWAERGGSRLAVVYQFRTGWIELYDLGV